MTARREGGVRALLAAMRGIGWVAGERRVVPDHVERRLRSLEDAALSGG
jgi:hypothetical protein